MRTKLNPALAHPEFYCVMAPGELARWTEWPKGIVVSSTIGGGWPVTTFSGRLDQAALHSLQRHLYALGVSLTSLVCLTHDD